MSASPFAKQASNNEGSENYELPTVGLHAARLIGIFDIGTHHGEYKGKPNMKRSNFIVWELMDCRTTEGKPFVVGNDFNESLGKNSNWRILLEGWRGRPFADKEPFDPFVLLGVACIVNLQLGVSGNKKFVDVTSVSTPMQGQSIPPATIEPAWFHLSAWGDPTIEPIIPEWCPRIYGRLLVDDIKKSDEWKDLIQKHAVIPASNGNGQKPGTGPAPQQTQPLNREYAPATNGMEREAAPF